MYLALLNDKEKELFLGLAYDIASADGNYSDAEKATIAGYCQEMLYDFDEKTMVKSVDSIIEEFKQTDSKTKKIVVFEAMGLAMADGKYDSTEKEIIAKMEDKFGIDKSYHDCCEKMLNEYISFQNNLNRLVIG